MILRELGLDIAPVLTGAGIVGLAVGFGAQTLVRDIISGFFLILEDQVRVGDAAAINGTAGLVEAINLRTIVLRDVEGTVHVFPTARSTRWPTAARNTRTTSSISRLSYSEDPDRVAAVLREVGEELQRDDRFGPLILEPLEIMGVDAFADWWVQLRLRIKTMPLKQWDVGRELRRRILKRVRGARHRDVRRRRSGRPAATSRADGRRCPLLPARLLDDLDAGAGADAARAGGHHRLQPFEIADAAGRLHAHLRADHPAHQRHVGGRRAARAEAGRGLHEVGPGRLARV